MTSDELIPQLDGSLFCPKCNSTITITEDYVLEVHRVNCKKWSAK